jgi:hypothetical protein
VVLFHNNSNLMDLKLLGVIAFFGPITMCIFGNTSIQISFYQRLKKLHLFIHLLLSLVIAM